MHGTTVLAAPFSSLPLVLRIAFSFQTLHQPRVISFRERETRESRNVSCDENFAILKGTIRVVSNEILFGYSTFRYENLLRRTQNRSSNTPTKFIFPLFSRQPLQHPRRQTSDIKIRIKTKTSLSTLNKPETTIDISSTRV